MDFNDKVLGPYHIQWEIGRGGTAVVYQATDTRSGQAVALKILLPQIATDQIFLKRFIKEGKHAIRLCHENIVPTYETGEFDGIYYIAMELVTGGTLAELSNQRHQLLTIDESINILSQIAAALDFAHSQGFLHRDVKPSNVLIGEDGRVLLTDFGTAKQMAGENTILTATGHRIGTPSFMSPEQISGDIQVDYRSDVYSLGVIAYQLFTGRLPFVGSSQVELLHKIVYETPILPDTLNPELPPNVVHNLKRALAKDPNYRYESAGQFVAAIVAGQIWASKFTAKHASSTPFGPAASKVAKHTGRHLQMRKAAIRPVLAALLIISLFLPPSFNFRNLSLLQIQTWTIAQADSLSSILMAFFDSPRATALWEEYGDPLVNNSSLDVYPEMSMQERIRNIWADIIHFKDANGWVQRTWRYWNRVKVSDLLN